MNLSIIPFDSVLRARNTFADRRKAFIAWLMRALTPKPSNTNKLLEARLALVHELESFISSELRKRNLEGEFYFQGQRQNTTWSLTLLPKSETNHNNGLNITVWLYGHYVSLRVPENFNKDTSSQMRLTNAIVSSPYEVTALVHRVTRVVGEIFRLHEQQ